MLKRSGKILLEGTLAEFKNYPRGVDGREYVLMNIEEKGPGGSYAFYEKDEKGDIIPVSYKGTEGYDAAEFIQFTDPEFERIILANFNTNPKGGITTKEADAITDIGQLFKGNTSLVTTEDLALLKNVKTIPQTAFQGCTNLQRAIIPEQINVVENKCFDQCSNLKTVKIYGNTQPGVGSARFGQVNLDSLEFYGDTSTFPIGIGGDVDASSVFIDDSVNTITSNTFKNFTSLTEINIPSSVTSIGSEAFYSCTSLTSVTIPGSVTAIGYNAFKNCTSLTSVIIESGVASIGSSVFEGCSNLSSVILPESLTTIGNGAFSDCTSLTSIVIPKGEVAIADNAFIGCTNLISATFHCKTIGSYLNAGKNVSLEQVIIGNEVTTIGQSAFNNCVNITSINIPSSVTSIGGFAFKSSGIISIDIPSSVSSIGGASFDSCTNLTYIKCYSETPATISAYYYGHPFNNITASCTLYVPINSLEAYQTANYWKDFQNIVGFEPEEETQE